MAALTENKKKMEKYSVNETNVAVVALADNTNDT